MIAIRFEKRRKGGEWTCNCRLAKFRCGRVPNTLEYPIPLISRRMYDLYGLHTPI